MAQLPPVKYSRHNYNSKLNHYRQSRGRHGGAQVEGYSRQYIRAKRNIYGEDGKEIKADYVDYYRVEQNGYAGEQLEVYFLQNKGQCDDNRHVDGKKSGGQRGHK